MILQYHLHFQLCVNHKALDFFHWSSAKQKLQTWSLWKVTAHFSSISCKIWGIIHAWSTKWWNKDATKAQYFPKVTFSDIASFCHSNEKTREKICSTGVCVECCSGLSDEWIQQLNTISCISSTLCLITWQHWNQYETPLTYTDASQ